MSHASLRLLSATAAVAIASFGLASTAGAVAVPITNPGFETYTDTANGGSGKEEFGTGNVTGWTAPAGDNGVQNGIGVGGTVGAFLSANNALTQAPSVNAIVIAPGTYTLSFAFKPNDYFSSQAPTAVTVNFLTSGGATIAGSAINLPQVGPGQPAPDFATQSSSLTVNLGDAIVGQTLGFSIASSTAYPSIDNVALDFQAAGAAVPEPVSLGLLAGVAGLALGHRRNRRDAR